VAKTHSPGEGRISKIGGEKKPQLKKRLKRTKKGRGGWGFSWLGRRKGYCVKKSGAVASGRAVGNEPMALIILKSEDMDQRAIRSL